MKYNYYIGLQLPEPISSHIAHLQRELHDPAHTIPPLEPHITLLPPPALEKVKPEEVAPKVREIAKAFLPLPITLTKPIRFGPGAIAISVSSPAIHNLQRRLWGLVPPGTELTYFPRPEFTPHVTLAHATRGKEIPSGVIEAYEQRIQPLLPAELNIPHVTLFRWLAPRTYRAEIL